MINEYEELMNIPNFKGDIMPHFCEIAYLNKIFKELKHWEHFSNYHFLFVTDQTILTGQIPPRTVVILNKEQGVLEVFNSNVLCVFSFYKLSTFPKNTIVFDIPLGYNIDCYPFLGVTKKKSDIFFSGQINPSRDRFNKGTKYIRRKLWWHNLYKRKKINYFINTTTEFRTGLTPKEYGLKLSEAKFALCPPGISHPTTFRFFEAMLARCIIISEELPDTWYYKNAPYLKTNDWTDYYEELNKIINNEHEYEKFQIRIKNYIESVFNERTIAEYIKKKLISLKQTDSAL